MSNFKILDCTLRDGGYINNWNFGIEKTRAIISLLVNSNIDFIETGFLSDETSSSSQTLYDSFEKLEKFIPDNADSSRLTCMIAYGKFNIRKVPDSSETKIKTLRLIFKKKQRAEALEYARKLIDKGYRLFINLTFIDQYQDGELLDLFEKINALSPFGMSIADSMGVLGQDDILKLYYLADNNISEKIALCFHSHNNLRMSFSNAKCLIQACKTRELIIDAAVFGMGRGAGNLCTELLIKYLNDNFDGKYNIVPVLKIAEDYLSPIFAHTPWGYSASYYLSAINRCHPDYAKFLKEKHLTSTELMDSLLKAIPDSKKAYYDEELIKKIYSEHI